MKPQPRLVHSVPGTTQGANLETGPDYALIENLFFAYRDFVGEADRLLERHGYGRAHHRVLHFIHRNQGLTIAALLDILQITKQSLARVLKDLIEDGLIEQRAGSSDRRQRHLYVMPEGQKLARALAQMQGARIERALGVVGPENRALVSAYLAALCDPSEDKSPLSPVAKTFVA